jgi:rRNA processing protein Gar1
MKGSLLCFEDGLIMGKICEIFGPITTPFYVVRWAAVKVALAQGSSGRGMTIKKKKKGKKGVNSLKADKGETICSTGDDALNRECNDEDDDVSEAVEMAVAADGGAKQEDITAIDEINVVSEIVSAPLAVGVSADCPIPTQASVGGSPSDPSNATSAAQAEHFASLVSRALPGTSGNTRVALSIRW